MSNAGERERGVSCNYACIYVHTTLELYLYNNVQLYKHCNTVMLLFIHPLTMYCHMYMYACHLFSHSICTFVTYTSLFFSYSLIHVVKWVTLAPSRTVSSRLILIYWLRDHGQLVGVVSCDMGVVNFGVGVVTVGVDCASYGVYQVVNPSEH